MQALPGLSPLGGFPGIDMDALRAKWNRIRFMQSANEDSDSGDRALGKVSRVARAVPGVGQLAHVAIEGRRRGAPEWTNALNPTGSSYAGLADQEGKFSAYGAGRFALEAGVAALLGGANPFATIAAQGGGATADALSDSPYARQVGSMVGGFAGGAAPIAGQGGANPGDWGQFFGRVGVSGAHGAVAEYLRQMELLSASGGVLPRQGGNPVPYKGLPQMSGLGRL